MLTDRPAPTRRTRAPRHIARLASLTLLALTQTSFADAHGTEMTCPDIVGSKSGPIAVERLAELDMPWGMDDLPDGALLVTEKPGALRRYADGTLSEPISGLPEVAFGNQGGLLDVAVHPDFERNGLVYVYFVEAAAQQPADPEIDADPRLGPYIDMQDRELKGGAVARGRLGGDALTEVKIIWRQTPKVVGLGHFGGRLLFAPDGKLIITSGERQLFEPAQDDATNLGKIVRVNDDGTIPEDNPFAGAAAPRDAVWSSGHRNPLGAAIRPETGDLYIHEMGPLFGDELNRPRAGRDYGWPTVSNGEHYNLAQIPHHETAPEYAAPELYWRPAISPSGLDFYTGSLFPDDWRNNALIGGLSSQAIVRVAFKGDYVLEEERIAMQARIRDVMTARDGSVLVLTDAEDGALLRLTPASAEQLACR